MILLQALAGCQSPGANRDAAPSVAGPMESEASSSAESALPRTALEPGMSWQWQLAEPPVDVSVQAQVSDIDLFDNGADVVAVLHAEGRLVFC